MERLLAVRNYLIFLITLISFTAIAKNISSKTFLRRSSDVKTRYSLVKFKQNTYTSISRNYSKKYLWMKVTLSPSSKKQFIVIDSPLINKIVAFGDLKKITREKNIRLGVVYNVLKHKNKITLYFRIKSHHVLDFKVLLFNNYKKLYQYYINKSLPVIILLGGCLALFLFNLIFFFSIKDTIILLYMFFLTSYFFCTLSINGFLNILYPKLSDYFLLLSMTSAVLTMVFTFFYYNLQKSRVIKYFYYFLISISLILVIIFLSGNIYLGYFEDFIIVSTSSLCLITSFLNDRKKSHGGRFYLYSWVALVFGMLSYFIVRDYFNISNVFFDNILLISSFVALILLSLAALFRFEELNSKKLLNEYKANNYQRYQRLLRSLVHDVSNPISIINPLVRRIIKTEEATLKDEYYSKIKLSISSISNILQNARMVEKNHQNEVELSILNLHDLISEALLFFELKVEDKNIKFNYINSDRSLTLWTNETVFVNQVLNNILSNSLKFSNKNEFIDIKVTKDESDIIIKITNFGKEISDSVISELNQGSFVSSKLGTEGEQGTGFGLTLIQDYVLLLNGEFYITKNKKDQNFGTTVSLKFKLN